MELLEVCAKTSVLLFLWCNLYFSINRRSVRRTEKSCCGPNQKSLIKTTGSVLPVLPSGSGPESKWCLDDVAWISAAGDYVELRTRNYSPAARDMNSLGQKLDPTSFARIHRSKIINLSRILELRSIENHGYIVKLCDGSQHRSSRTYADQLERWLHSTRP